MYELGYAHALCKPTIIIGQDTARVPFNVLHRPVIMYDRNQLTKQLVSRLADALVVAHHEPERYVDPHDVTNQDEASPTAFISYSHADREAFDRLQVHLKPLQRAELVEVWADTRIKARDKWKEQITRALDKAAIAVLLISADALASHFIVDNELPPLLAAAEGRGTIILPVILKPESRSFPSSRTWFLRRPSKAKPAFLSTREDPGLFENTSAEIPPCACMLSGGVK
jgi:hypothetical protein